MSADLTPQAVASAVEAVEDLLEDRVDYNGGDCAYFRKLALDLVRLVHLTREREVTEEMVAAGSECLWQHELPPSEKEMPALVTAIYQAMEAARSRPRDVTP